MATGRLATMGGILSRLRKQRFGDLTVILDRKGNVLDVNNDEMTLKVSVPVTVGFVITSVSPQYSQTEASGTITSYYVYGTVPAGAIQWKEYGNVVSFPAGTYNGASLGSTTGSGWGGSQTVSGKIGWNSVTEYQTKTVKIKNGKIVSVS